MRNPTRREAILGGLALLGSACNFVDSPSPTPTPEPTVKPMPSKIIENGKTVTFPNGVVANFTQLPIRVTPRSLDLICRNPGYGINAEEGQIGFYVLADSNLAENNPTLRIFLEGLMPSLRNRYTTEQEKQPLNEFKRIVPFKRLLKEHLDAVPLKPENLPILAHNFGVMVTQDWAEFTYSQIQKRAKIPGAGERLTDSASRMITSNRPFQIPELTPEMYQKLKAA